MKRFMYKLMGIKLVIIQIDNNCICAKPQTHIQIYEGVVYDREKGPHKQN